MRWEAFITQKTIVEMPEELLTNIIVAQELKLTISPACMDSWLMFLMSQEELSIVIFVQLKVLITFLIDLMLFL